MGTDTGAFSGGEHSCGACRAQADRHAARVGGGVVDLEYGSPVAYAAAVLPELQNSASTLSALAPPRSTALGLGGFGQYAARAREP